VFSLIFVNAQTPKLEWAKSMGGIGGDYAYAVSVDGAGDVYTIGTFQQTADFDPGTGVFNLYSTNLMYNSDIYISKLDAKGNFLWAKSIGTELDEIGIAIAVDASGNIYATGSFNGTVDFDPGVGIHNLTSKGGYDIFILKLDSYGNYAWAKDIGGTANDQGNSIALDSMNNIYVSGFFHETIDFIPSNGVKSITTNGGSDIFVLKLNTSGKLVWAKNMGGTYDDSAYYITVDAIANVYTTGVFRGKADFDPSKGEFNLSTKGNPQYEDVFISKLDSTGYFKWAKSISGNFVDQGNCIAVDATGNVYVTGGFQYTADFDPGPDTSNLISFGDYDIFILKLDSYGNYIWAKNMGGNQGEIGNSLVLDAIGNIYVTGSFNGSPDFDPGPSAFNLTSSGFLDIFISKLDTAGIFKWAVNMGGIDDDFGYALSIDKSDNLYITGAFSQTTDFDPGQGTFNLKAVGSDDVYISKLSQSSVATKENLVDNKLNLYPNPTTGFLNVLITNPSKGQRIEIYNSLGVLMYTQTDLNEFNIIDLKNQPDGMYMLRLVDETNIGISKIIVKTE
ncbi:MAG TPA: T9SS type A sorting domain-containing protein, partial [Saprospiraceae bacterium]|nr:T9SS type A sorting domain-containing protein [Saprospiraceae bacterium]